MSFQFARAGAKTSIQTSARKKRNSCPLATCHVTHSIGSQKRAHSTRRTKKLKASIQATTVKTAPTILPFVIYIRQRVVTTDNLQIVSKPTPPRHLCSQQSTKIDLILSLPKSLMRDVSRRHILRDSSRLTMTLCTVVAKMGLDLYHTELATRLATSVWLNQTTASAKKVD